MGIDSPEQRRPRHHNGERGPAIIRLENVSKTYSAVAGVEVPALREVDLTIETGDMVAITGTSGSGTTTLMNILGCLDVPTSGRYILDGRDLSGLSKRQLTRTRATTVGFAFHLADLRRDTNLVRNVELPLIFNVSPRARHQRAMRALEHVGLDRHATDMPAELSPAQHRRAIIARALITQPKLLLQDEPTADLDTESGLEILELLTTLNNTGTTIVFSTHEPHIAARAHRVVQLADGQVQTNHNTTDTP
jgi:putative ABC transport system ATP-binding protein